MDYYRDTFPSASVLPKMHILESHVVPFIRKWGVGLGLLAEQGAERPVLDSFSSVWLEEVQP